MAQGTMKTKHNGISGFIFHDARLVIYPAAKAARTSIVRTLAGVYHVGGGNVKSTVGKLKIREEFDPSQYYKIGVCRNPWARMHSIYVNKLIDRRNPNKRLANLGFYGGMSFDSFIKLACAIPDDHTEKHLRSQYRTLQQSGELDCLIKFEKLGAGWRKIQKLFFERCGRRVGSLERHNVSGTMRPAWTTDLVKLVAIRYARDVQLFGYEGDVPYVL